MTKKLKKGCTAQLNPIECFPIDQFGGQKRRVTGPTGYLTNDGISFFTWRPTTFEERQAWYDSPRAKGITCDGELPLAPSTERVLMVRGNKYLVLRARCRVQLGMRGGPESGMAHVQCVETGENTYIKREFLEAL